MEQLNICQNSLFKQKTNAGSKFATSDGLILLFWAFYLFVRLWVADSENLTSAYDSVRIIPYIDKNIGNIMLLLTVTVFGGLLIIHRFSFDSLFPSFLLRIGLYFIPVLYLEGAFEFGVAFAVIQTMLAYYIGYNYKGKLNVIVNFLIVASLMLLGQIFYVVLYHQLSVFDIQALKWHMRLPGGQTNTLGAFLVIIYVVVDCFYQNSKKPVKYVYFILMCLGLWCVGTRSGILVLIGYYALKWTKNILLRKKKKPLTLSKALLGLLVIGGAIAVFFVFKDGIIERLKIFTIQGMTNTRLKVYLESLQYIQQNLFLGRSAFSYTVYDAVRTHNVVLESLIQTGIIGTVVYFFIWGYCFKQVSKIREKNVRALFQFFIIITLLHGSVEPNLFSITSDTLAWFIVGVGVSMAKREEKNNAQEHVEDNKA